MGPGDLYIADSSNHAIRKLSLATGRLDTVAGQLNQQGYSGDGGLATEATLNTPEGLAFDPNGNLYIADTKNHVIRKLDITTGLIKTYAGVGTRPGFSGDGGAATVAQMNAPWGIATSPQGELFIADLNNNRVRKVAIDGTITTVVGTGSNDYATDGQSGLLTTISNPAAVAVDVAGNLYVADSGHNIVRKMNAITGITVAVIGTGNATFMGDKAPAHTCWALRTLCFNFGRARQSLYCRHLSPPHTRATKLPGDPVLSAYPCWACLPSSAAGGRK